MSHGQILGSSRHRECDSGQVPAQSDPGMEQASEQCAHAGSAAEQGDE